MGLTGRGCYMHETFHRPKYPGDAFVLSMVAQSGTWVLEIHQGDQRWVGDLCVNDQFRNFRSSIIQPVPTVFIENFTLLARIICV